MNVYGLNKSDRSFRFTVNDAINFINIHHFGVIDVNFGKDGFFSRSLSAYFSTHLNTTGCKRIVWKCIACLRCFSPSGGSHQPVNKCWFTYLPCRTSLPRFEERHDVRKTKKTPFAFQRVQTCPPRTASMWRLLSFLTFSMQCFFTKSHGQWRVQTSWFLSDFNQILHLFKNREPNVFRYEFVGSEKVAGDV